MHYKVKPWDHQLKAIERAKDKPHFALFFEQGCVASSTTVSVNRGGCSRKLTIEQLYRSFNRVELDQKGTGYDPSIPSYIRSMVDDQIRLNLITGVVRSGEKFVVRLTIGGKNHLKLTPDHEVFTQRGFVPVQALRIGKDLVAIDTLRKHEKTGSGTAKRTKYRTKNVGPFHPYSRQVETAAGKFTNTMELHRIVYEASLNGVSLDQFIANTRKPNSGMKFVDPSKFHIHHIDHNPTNNHTSNLQCLAAEKHRQHHATYDNFKHGTLAFRTVTAIEPVGLEMTYDVICADPYRNFVANGIVIHNCGKTSTAINIVRHKYLSHGETLPTLVLCPPIVIENWKREFLTHSEVDASHIVCLVGKQRVRVADFYQHVLNGAGRIVITNYESLLVPDLVELLRLWVKVLICDESHKCKDLSTKRTKAALSISKMALYRYILSGTPVVNSAFDIYSQFLILDGGETFGPKSLEFRRTYFMDHNAHRARQNYFPDWRPRAGALSKINAKVYEKAMRVRKDECLDLPPLVRQVVDFQLSDEQTIVYGKMEKDAVAYFQNTVISADLAIKKALRLQQITSGFVTDDEGKTVEFKDNGRRSTLSEVVQTIPQGHKFIVWSVFKYDYRVIASVLQGHDIPFVELHGGTDPKDRQEIVDRFNSNGGPRALIGHPGSAGVGVNLTAASYAIFYSRGFSLENDLQAEARNHRGGSERHKTIHRIDLVARGTVDEQVLCALQDKQDVSETILRYMRRGQV
jgi:SNF2 family DNA or RNA helicase